MKLDYQVEFEETGEEKMLELLSTWYSIEVAGEAVL
jgi:hypothetical protein